MNYQLSVKLRNCITARAHLYGAEALILEREADALAAKAGPAPATIQDANPFHLEALSRAQLAHQARRRYFRELEAADLLGGHSSPFGALG